MSDEENAQEVKEQAEKSIGGLISKEEAIKIAEEQGGSREELEAQGEAAASSPKPSNELKVLIIMKADKLMLGVQSPDCDPVYMTMQGSLAMALKKVPALVADAKLKWEANPRYPKADLPTPPPSPTPARTPTAPRVDTPKSQPSFF